MFKKLKSLFVVEETAGVEEKLEAAVSKKQKKSSKKQQTVRSDDTVAKPVAEQEVFVSDIKGPAKPQKKFTTILLKAMDRNNLEGNDYLEFKQSLKSLTSVIEDEATRFKSSFAVLTNSGVDKAKLITSSDHYIKVLEAERTKFESTFKEQQTKQVQARETKIAKIDKGIAQRKAQLKKLISEIEQMEADLKAAKVEINQAAGKVQLTKDQFMASYRMIIEQIQEDKEKINQYI